MQVGDTLPDATLFEGDPKTKVNIKDVFKGKKGELGWSAGPLEATAESSVQGSAVLKKIQGTLRS